MGSVSTAHMNLLLKYDNLPKYFTFINFLYFHVVYAGCSFLIYTMLVMRVVEFVLITVVALLITVVAVRHFRAGGDKMFTNLCSV